MTQEEELLERIKRLRTVQEPEMAALPLQRDYRLPTEPEVSSGGTDPRLTRADELERQAQPPVRTGGLGPQILKSALEGIASSNMPGGYMAYRQQQDQNERQRQQDLLSRVNQLRSQSADAEQLGLQRRTLALNEQKASGDFEEQLARVNLLRNPKPKFSSGAQGIYNEETGEVTSPAVRTPVRDPNIGKTIDTQKGIMGWNSETGRYDIPQGQAKASAAAGQDWVTRNGKLIPIPKGTAQPGDKPYDEVAARTTTDGGSSDYATERAYRTTQSVDELMPQVNNWTVGPGSLLKGVPTTTALDFAAQLETLKGAIALNELVQMRSASKTGGGLGNVSDRELTVLSSALGALDQRQSVDNFKKQLTKIRGSVERWEKAVAEYGNNAGPEIGTIENGYIFQGGNPADPNSWKKQ